MSNATSAKKNVLLICGGGGTEHEVSLVSAKYIEENLHKMEGVESYFVEICKDGNRRTKDGSLCELRKDGELCIGEKKIKLDFAIPCIHGIPGETGELPALFEMMRLPYLGNGPEASVLCFNKISTKLWLNALGVPNTPYIFLNSLEDLPRAKKAMAEWKHVFVKAASQGSSVGCYSVKGEEELTLALRKAFKYSPYVLIEKAISGRELEVSTYEYEGKIVATYPGEIICQPGSFYSYNEKYGADGHTKTATRAENISSDISEKIRNYALDAFVGLKLRHLSRIDFFLSNNGEIFLNEINTFPGMTPISMFPKMMEEYGHSFEKFLKDIIFA
ncbi:MAG: D-alanine--D-alanine ligase A [Bdellovibrionales bacterium RIFOXYD12_FULL_39_22]|nr:MAG: D-alanine--D-alanine ligase A [Bdellovibrionales bacterium RIFOXYB1_FULL_39_21]OFZ40849.1 MAG: D-alanine--D-alanine ligase A [Bdellovibrionales bacterium RIFOXYC12_FULL_39_17]OFZ44390.1 MAG: D-alanine--D-alanine ligase A [Bdellovibrionales bacterium RIFOXYC1_FULL_39_130]OFZ74137.1 MAG: D-alanine--D-alanine ligase A [Bdellovibrionales bacterium RIFOXYD1_FULL_39_84]OFZ91986.1 MAG: D-alanine--D-alanine ligase A [Bdellovibrionales bacterium RIFOXYD12_FULL_39_22]HLE12303.1 D-alanine--D-alan